MPAVNNQLPKDPIAEEMAATAKESIRKAQEERFNDPTAGPPAAAGGK